MTKLKITHADGDILSAGVITTSSGLNAIAYETNTKTKFVGSTTEFDQASSTGETTLGAVTIPANTVSSRVVCYASVGASSNQASQYSEFKLKTGTISSETTRQTIRVPVVDALNADEWEGGAMLYVDEASDFTSQISVIVTGQNKTSGATERAMCWQLVVLGD